MADKKPAQSLNPFGEESCEVEQPQSATTAMIIKDHSQTTAPPTVAAETTQIDKKKGSRYEPVPKYGHCTAHVNDKLYLWGGWQKGFPEVHTSIEKLNLTSALEIFDLQKGEWQRVDTYGSPPLGVRGGCCTTIGDNIYYFGGYCGHEWCRHNSLHSLDTTTLHWTELSNDNPNQSPMRKNACGMISFNENNQDFLFVFGGVGMLASANQPEAIYIPWKDNPNFGWTNEAHIFSLKEGHWYTPELKGDRPPPGAGFTLTKITHNSALLYGGIDATTGKCLSDTYIVEITFDTIHWHKLPFIQGQPKPNNRHDHAAVCISGPLHGQIKPMVMISGGRDSKWQSLGDLWLLDCSNGSWKQCEVPLSVAQRHFHSISVFPLSNYCVYSVMYGGIKEWLQNESASGQPMLSDTTVLEISLRDDDNNWEVSAVLNSELLTGTEEYKGRLVKRLFQIINTQTSDGSLQQDLIKLRSQLEETQLRLRQAQEKIHNLEQELAESRSKQITAQQSTISITDSLPLPPPPLSLLHSTGSHINAEEIAMEMTSDALKPHLISRQELTLTGPDIDSGAYGRTLIAKYKENLQVTAKLLVPSSPNQTTPYSQMVLCHKLVQSFQLRHPNIMQLLFVVKETEVVIVTEATPTTLRSLLEKKQLSKVDIISMTNYVSMALSYLHSHKPYPIVHRGIASNGIVIEYLASGKCFAKIVDFFTSNYFYHTFPEMPFVIDSSYIPPSFSLPLSPQTPLNPKFDIFSLGVVIMETITRKLPLPDSAKREKVLTTIKWPPMVSLIRECTREEVTKRPTADGIISTLQNL